MSIERADDMTLSEAAVWLAPQGERSVDMSTLYGVAYAEEELSEAERVEMESWLWAAQES